jgi:NLR family CARD domain-containing protein 3
MVLPATTEGKLLVYIHFDFECYEPRLISQNELHVRYITMVPPKKYRYFFSHAQQPLLDVNAQVEDLPIAETHSYEVEHVQHEIKVDKVNYRTSKSKRIVNDYNEIAVKTLPRFNGLVARKVKNPWTYAQSVWGKEWKLDDEELLRKCFEKDWKHSKIMNLIKNQADLEKVRGLLWANYSSIKTIYRQFASWSPFGDVWAVSNQPFTEFCQQARIINKDTPLKITDLTFITTNSMSGPDWKGNALIP